MKINEYSTGSNSKLLTEFVVVVPLVNKLMSSFHDLHLMLRWMDVAENLCKPIPEHIICSITTVSGKIRYINLSFEIVLTPNSTSRHLQKKLELLSTFFFHNSTLIL